MPNTKKLPSLEVHTRHAITPLAETIIWLRIPQLVDEAMGQRVYKKSETALQGAIMDEYKSIADTINDECIEFLEITYNNKVSAERFSEMSTDELDSMPDLDELVRQDAERLANIPYLMEIAKQPDKGVVDTLNDILKPDELVRQEAQKLNQEIHNADY